MEKRKRYSALQIFFELRDADVMLAPGKHVLGAIQSLEVSEAINSLRRCAQYVSFAALAPRNQHGEPHNPLRSLQPNIS
jgi:hypothetical protein